MFDHILLQPDMETFNVSILQALLYPPHTKKNQLEMLEISGYSEVAIIRSLKKVRIYLISLRLLAIKISYIMSITEFKQTFILSLFQINELFSGESKIFMFLFSSLLFNSTGDDVISNKLSNQELNVMQKLERYLSHHFKGDITRSAFELGNTIETIQFLQTL